MISYLGLLLLFTVCTNSCVSLSLWPKSQDEGPVKDGDNYGVDVTFPIHHKINPNSEYGKKYASMMQGCYDAYSKRECDMTEEQRLDMSIVQPRSQHNYTELGFKKMKVPDAVWEVISKFWDANKHNPVQEKWPRGNTYTNHWDAPTEFVSLEDVSRIGGGMRLKNQIWDGMKPILSDWVGEELKPTSLYGIRIYREGAILSTHVDRLPLVTSAIVQVAQENIETPWPIEVYSHDGKAYNFTMKPGEMVLYESHSVLHGRPFPLKGSLYANLFVHFEPIRHNEINAGKVDPKKIPGRRLRKASDNAGHEGSDVDQHGYQQDHGQQQKVEHHRYAVEDHDPVSIFGGKKHSIKDDHETILNHRKRLEEAAARKAELLKKVADTAPGAIKKEKKVYRNPKPSPKLQEYLQHKDKDDLHSEDEEDSTKMRSILHQMAANGDLETTKFLLESKTGEELKLVVNVQDSRGWQPLHEAIRGGYTELVQYLIEQCGASYITHTGSKNTCGGTALWWAQKLLDPTHPIISYLADMGAPIEGQEA